MSNLSQKSKPKSQLPSNQTLFAMLNGLEGLTYPSVFATPSLSIGINLTLSNKTRNYLHTPEQIAKELAIDETGKLWWIRCDKYKRRNMERSIGSIDKYGYLHFRLKNELYSVHTVAFCLYYGRWPHSGKCIDHVNGITTDNRKENLREVSYSTNLRNRHRLNSNNKTGYCGVFQSGVTGKFVANIKINGKTISKEYNTLEEAVNTRSKWEIEFGFTPVKPTNDIFEELVL